jgi:rhamnulokinase
MATMAAVDLGAQSGRVAVGRFDGERLEVTEVHRFANEPVQLGESLHWDILGLYREALAGLRAAAAVVDRIDSVGVDSWAVDFALVDRRDRLLGNPVHYRDGRRAAALETVLQRVPARELYERTGIQILPINTLYELAALAAEGDPVLAAAENLLMIPDLLHLWLAGTRVGEWTNATSTQCLDARTGDWADDLLDRLGIPTRLLPELVEPATSLGPLLAGVAVETGLGAATVVAVGTHDTASAVAAIPFRHAGSAYVSAGTWSLVGVEVREPLITDESFASNLTNEGGVGGTFRLLRNVTGLWLLHECRRIWANAGRRYSFDELVTAAEGAPPLRSLVDPNHLSFAAPGDMPARIREFCTATGQPEPQDPPAVTRCILESLALKHAETVELLGSATGAAPTEIHLVGGGARNPLICRWTAAASGLPVLVGPEEATLLGNLLVQAIALGEVGSVAEAREVVRASFAPVVHEPEPANAWQEARSRFADLGGAGATTLEVVA